MRKPTATTGIYCIMPAAGIDPATTIPVVSLDISVPHQPDIFSGAASGLPGEFEVVTADDTGSVANANFSSVIP